MDETSRADRTTIDAITATELRFLTLIEEVAAADALTEDDRHQLSFEVEVLCTELRACVDPSPWE